MDDEKGDLPEKAGKGPENAAEGGGKVAGSRKSSEEVPPSGDASTRPPSRRSSRGWTPKTFENVGEPVDLKALLRNKSLNKVNPKLFSVRPFSAFTVCANEGTTRRSSELKRCSLSGWNHN